MHASVNTTDKHQDLETESANCERGRGKSLLPNLNNLSKLKLPGILNILEEENEIITHSLTATQSLLNIKLDGSAPLVSVLTPPLGKIQLLAIHSCTSP